MMRPLFWRRMIGRTAFVTRMTPKTLISKRRCAWVIEDSSAPPSSPMPGIVDQYIDAIGFRPSMSATSFDTDASSLTSNRPASPRRQGPHGCGFRLVPENSKTGFLPEAMERLPRPIPVDAPVTRATPRLVVAPFRFLSMQGWKGFGKFDTIISILSHYRNDMNNKKFLSTHMSRSPWRRLRRRFLGVS